MFHYLHHLDLEDDPEVGEETPPRKSYVMQILLRSIFYR